MANKECTKCIHNAVCKTAESCDGYVSGCKHFKEGWISVYEQMPELSTLVIGYAKRYPFSAFYAMGVMWVGNGWVCPVLGRYVECTHWMPLPQPPKGE